MLARQIGKFLRHSYSRAIVNCRNVSSGNVEPDAERASRERDPAPFFFDKEVQVSLRKLTTIDYKKVFRPRMDEHRLKRPEYKFMTDEELKESMDAAKRKAKRYLQMPPVVKRRLEIRTVLEKDAALQGYDTVKYVFTDITFGLKDKERLIVVRQPDGTLRHAKWRERDRLLQTYFPKAGRNVRKPIMFGGSYLKNLLERNKYEFILDRACIQFEPDDLNYQTVTRTVYEHVNLEKHFEALRSTRHFGPMVFHLVWTSNIDNLLCEMIETERMEDAALLIRLYQKIQPTAESAVNQCKDDSSDEEIVMHYARLDSARTGTIEKLVRSYEELRQQRKEVEEGIKKAHGLTSDEAETDKVEMETLEMEKLETEKLETEKLETEKLEMEKLETEKLETEKLETEKLETEKLETEKLETEKLEAEKLETEKLETEKLETEKLETEKLEAEKLETEKLETEKLETKKVETDKEQEDKV